MLIAVLHFASSKILASSNHISSYCVLPYSAAVCLLVLYTYPLLLYVCFMYDLSNAHVIQMTYEVKNGDSLSLAAIVCVEPTEEHIWTNRASCSAGTISTL